MLEASQDLGRTTLQRHDPSPTERCIAGHPQAPACLTKVTFCLPRQDVDLPNLRPLWGIGKKGPAQTVMSAGSILLRLHR